MNGVAALLSVLCGVLVGIAVLSLTERRVSVARRVSAYIDPIVTTRDPERSLIERALGDRQARTIARSPLLVRLRTELEVADLELGPARLVALILAAMIVIGWLLFTTTKSPIAAAMGLTVPFAARMLLGMKADRQRRAFTEQLPDNLQVISSAMRAGQNFVGALRAVLEDAPEPSRRELRRAMLDEQLGVPLTEALNRVTERMHSDDFQHVAIVASLQRETGGNTAEVLDLVGDTIRERIELRRMVRGLTAQGRLSGGVLSLLPVGLLMFMSVLNPSYVHPLFHKTMGLIALGAAGMLILGGGLVIRKIVDIKV